MTRGKWPWEPVLKHGPDTAFGGNARERAWEHSTTLSDRRCMHDKVRLPPVELGKTD